MTKRTIKDVGLTPDQSGAEGSHDRSECLRDRLIRLAREGDNLPEPTAEAWWKASLKYRYRFQAIQRHKG